MMGGLTEDSIEPPLWDTCEEALIDLSLVSMVNNLRSCLTMNVPS